MNEKKPRKVGRPSHMSVIKPLLSSIETRQAELVNSLMSAVDSLAQKIDSLQSQLNLIDNDVQDLLEAAKRPTALPPPQPTALPPPQSIAVPTQRPLPPKAQPPPVGAVGDLGLVTLPPRPKTAPRPVPNVPVGPVIERTKELDYMPGHDAAIAEALAFQDMKQQRG